MIVSHSFKLPHACNCQVLFHQGVRQIQAAQAPQSVEDGKRYKEPSSQSGLQTEGRQPERPGGAAGPEGGGGAGVPGREDYGASPARD